MSFFDWFDDIFGSGTSGGGGGDGAGAGSVARFGISAYAAQVPYIGPIVGAYLMGREDLSSLTRGDEGYARSEGYERTNGSAPWRVVAVGDPINGLQPGVIDFTGSTLSAIDAGKPSSMRSETW